MGTHAQGLGFRVQGLGWALGIYYIFIVWVSEDHIQIFVVSDGCKGHPNTASATRLTQDGLFRGMAC